MHAMFITFLAQSFWKNLIRFKTVLSFSSQYFHRVYFQTLGAASQLHYAAGIVTKNSMPSNGYQLNTAALAQLDVKGTSVLLWRHGKCAE
jgi:hypothetical protein